MVVLICQKTGNIGWTKPFKTANVDIEGDLQEEQNPKLIESVPEEVREVTAINGILEYVTIDDATVQEIASCNVEVSSWEDQILEQNERGRENCEDLNMTDFTNMFNLLGGGESESPPSSTLSSAISDGSSLKACTPYVITYEDALKLLSLLQTHKQANKSAYWDHKGANDILKIFMNGTSLSKLRDVDLAVIVRYIKKTHPEAQKFALKESDRKGLKIEKLCKVFDFQKDLQSNNINAIPQRVKMHNPKSLASMSLKVLAGKKMPKEVLNIAYAGYIWPDKLQVFKEQSPISDFVKVDSENEPEFWFYTPEFSEVREQLEVKCVYSSHLLTRTRRKICKGGIENMNNSPWMRVALQRNTFLSLVMVEDTIYPMSVPMALTHISQEVEDAMIKNGDLKAAEFCHDVRNWWESEDKPGISANQRIGLRKGLRKRLLKGVNFGSFPPPSAYVNGWPAQLWEALLANIDAKAMLYSMCKNETYNVRAFSSMMCETFFAELYNQDLSGHGTVSAQHFGRYIESTLEQLIARLDTNRPFAYRTSKSTVYQLVDETDYGGPYTDTEERGLTAMHSKRRIQQIIPRDHFFDSEERARVHGKNKLGKVSTDRNALQNGTLGVRWEKSRVNESKILPMKKMGLIENS